MKNSGQTPLLNALVKRKRMKTIPFHMPGHKQGKGILRRFACLMRSNPFSLDLTEIPGLDDLHNPTGPIQKAQSRAAHLFGADRTFFLINGTTVGIHTAVTAVCKQGEEILLPRDIHRSAIGACILAGVRPRYLPVRLDNFFLVPYPPMLEDVALALQKYPLVKAVFQLHPSYYGLAGDLAGIAELAHGLNIPLVVDEAHGAHFQFSERLPLSALASGADLSIQSTHKTLGAFTQASMLHVKSKLINCSEVSRQLDILQTTSPSYLLMASLDAVTGHMESSGKALVERTVDIAIQVRNKINEIPGIKCLGEEVCRKNSVAAFDPTKLYISVQKLGLTGHQVAAKLLKEYRIQVELSNRFNILCMFSIGNSFKDADKLVRALREIADQRPRIFSTELSDLITFPLPQLIQTPREAWLATKKTVMLEDAVGEIAAEIIAPFPPGVPVLCPGELITYEIIEVIRRLKAEMTSFHGPADPALNRLTIIDTSHKTREANITL